MWSNIIDFWNKESPFNIPLRAHALLQKKENQPRFSQDSQSRLAHSN